MHAVLSWDEAMASGRSFHGVMRPCVDGWSMLWTFGQLPDRVICFHDRPNQKRKKGSWFVRDTLTNPAEGPSPSAHPFF